MKLFAAFAALMGMGDYDRIEYSPAKKTGKYSGFSKPRNKPNPAGTGKKIYRYARANFK